MLIISFTDYYTFESLVFLSLKMFLVSSLMLEFILVTAPNKSYLLSVCGRSKYIALPVDGGRDGKCENMSCVIGGDNLKMLEVVCNEQDLVSVGSANVKLNRLQRYRLTLLHR